MHYKPIYSILIDYNVLNWFLLNLFYHRWLIHYNRFLKDFTETRVDLHRPKMLIIQFHKLSLWKNTNHTIFIHFAKMVSSNFRRTFLLFWHKFWCIVLNKKEKIFVKKNANHTISIYGNCMTSIFLMATTKIFLSIFEIAPKIFFVFFSTAKWFSYSNKHFKMQNLIFCVYNVVLDILILNFFPFLLIKFFKNAEDSSFFVWHVFLCLDQCLVIWKFKF